MKKLIGIVAAVLMVAMMVGCKSSEKNNGAVLGGAQAARAAGRPGWAFYGCTFTSNEAASFIDNYKPTDSGYFAEGEAQRNDERSSQVAARLDARANLASFCKSEVARVANANNVGVSESALEQVDQIMTGSRIVDSVQDANGKVYILMFISDKDFKNSASTNPTLKGLVDALSAERFKAIEAESAASAN